MRLTRCKFKLIYVTGDTHGDYSKFRGKGIRKLKKNDSLIICGDFGFVWDGSKEEEKMKKKLGKKKYNILFVEGENDNLNLLNEIPTTDWNGGKVREISGRLKQLCRGSIFEIEGKKIFTFGGGDVILDRETYSIKPWQNLITPSEEEIEQAQKNLTQENNKVDYIITYQSTGKIKDMLTMRDNEMDVLDIFLNKVRAEVEYTSWFFGGFHIDKFIPPKDIAIFEGVVPISSDFNILSLNGTKRLRNK